MVVLQLQDVHLFLAMLGGPQQLLYHIHVENGNHLVDCSTISGGESGTNSVRQQVNGMNSVGQQVYISRVIVS